MSRTMRGSVDACCCCNRACPNDGDLRDLGSSFRLNGSPHAYRSVLETCFCFSIGPGAGVCLWCAFELERTWTFFTQIRTAQAQLQKTNQQFMFDCINAENIQVDVDVSFINDYANDNNPELKPEESSSEFSSDDRTLSQYRSDYQGDNKMEREFFLDVPYDPDGIDPDDDQINDCSTVDKASSNDEFVCDTCCKVFKNKFVLKRHLQAHEGMKEKCKLCGKMYKHECLWTHMQKSHCAKSLFMCTKCPETFSKTIDLKAHRVKRHGEKYRDFFKCMVVTLKENGRELLKKMCSTCGLTFFHQLPLFEHMKTHKASYVCHVCAKECRSAQTLFMHERRHVNNKLSCDICGKVFKQAEYLRLHRLNHGEEPLHRHKCPKCPEKFPSHYKKAKHLVEVHNEAPTVYRCKLCPKEYASSSTLSGHVKTIHKNQYDFKCGDCGAEKRNRKQLEEHMVTHTGAKDFKCNKCGKCFGRKFSLSEHLKIHNNVRNFACSDCELTFIQKCSLKSHMKIHGKQL